MYYTKEQIIEIMRDWLPVLRSSVNVTQADLCAAIGISRQTYSAIEIGKREMSWTVFLALFMYFIANSRSRTLVRKKKTMLLRYSIISGQVSKMFKTLEWNNRLVQLIMYMYLR